MAYRVPRGALTLVSAAAVLAVCYIGYNRLQHNPTAVLSNTGLHRSNAVRRRRRSPRTTPDEEGSQGDPIASAFERLAQREASGVGYGFYRNKHYVDDDLITLHGDLLTLLPTKLVHIKDIIADTHNMSDDGAEQLMMHIQAVFMQEFLREEFPDTYTLEAEVSSLSAGLGAEINPNVVKKMAELHDQGDEIKVDLLLGEQAADRMVGHPDPESLAHFLSLQDSTQRNGAGTAMFDDTHTQQTEGHNILDLLYRIGEEQAKWSGYQHRGVQCNGCGMQPIRGIRYHCANCWDYDLCETCEHQQIHHKTHVFYKIRIPAPTRGQIKLVQPKWYPGEPNACPESIPQTLKVELLRITNLDRQDLDALYDQFKCIAGRSWLEDPDEICMAIDRPSFDKYFTSTIADRPPRPNLIYDRIFCFYDQDCDDLINFSEFAKGTADLANNTSREARVLRLFRAFDLDGDGYVNRQDFLHMLQANYILNKELAYEMIFGRDDALLNDEDMHEVIQGNNPISAAFGGSGFAGHRSRNGNGKHLNERGDLILDNDLDEILRENSVLVGNRAEAIARQASEARSLIHGRRLEEGQHDYDDPIVDGHYLPPIPTMRDEDPMMASPRSGHADVERLGHIVDDWPTSHLQEQDVHQALGTYMPLEDVMDPMDRRRVLSAQRDRLFTELEASNLEVESTAVSHRWRRRKFYTDTEQGFAMPFGYAESDSSEDFDRHSKVNGKKRQVIPEYKPLSARSRSSSKVRFDDSAIDNDTSSRSDISSKNTPTNERWGGMEIGQPDRDVGVEIVYEAVQEAFNDMLNHIFKEKEDAAMDASGTRWIRSKYDVQLQKYIAELDERQLAKERQLLKADRDRTEALLQQFGNEGRESVILAADTELQMSACEESGVGELCASSSKAPTNCVGNEETTDLTLPQFRPNDENFIATAKVNTDGVVPFDVALLAKWHRHRQIDEEASERGGHGRLNLQELKQKLKEEYSEIDTGGDESEEDFWEAKADLGKFSFLSDWIEMASF